MKTQEFDFSVDLLRAILWQYNDAARLQSLLQQKQDWYISNQEEFWIGWVRDVFDMRTANEFGLSVWSIILDIPIYVQAKEPSEEDPAFGFNWDDDGNFENSNFRRSGFQAQKLSIEQARTVLMMRYHQITTDGTVPHINEFLARMFGESGGAYVVDNGDMTITYVLGFTPPSRLSYIFANYDILPRPAGVRIADINIVPKIPFGFDEHNNNYDNGNFKD